ncbi:MAG: hypothetical protein R3D00_31195 [Bacteroidia bacterium]
MKKIWAWAAQNTALAYLFFTQAACIIFGIYWGISSFFPKDEPNTPKNLLVTVSAYEDAARTVVDAYNAGVSNDYDMQLRVVSESEAVKTFAESKNAMLILSRKLTDAEISNVKSDRLPLSQDTLLPDSPPGTDYAFLISDHQNSPAEGKFLSFITNPAQPRRFAPKRRS